MAPPTLAELEEELKRDPRSRRFFELAREYQRAGRLSEAMGLCEKGLATYPNHWQARLLLAQIYVTKGNLEAGKDMVGKVLLAMHDSVPANHLAADIYWALGDKDRALKHYQIVDLLEPGKAGVRERLTELLLPPPAPTALQAPVEEEPLDLSPLEAPTRAVQPPPVTEAASHLALVPPPDEVPDAETPRRSAGEEAIEFVPEPQAPAEADRFEVVPLAPAAHEEPLPAEVQEVPWSEGETHDAELEADTASFATVLEPAASDQEELSAPVILPAQVPVHLSQDEEAPEIPAGISEEVPLSEEELAPGGSAGDGDPGMSTFTLAELYENQGYPEKAIEIYQRMLLRDPDNASIHARIRMLMQRMVGEAPEAPPVHQEDVEKALRQKRVVALQSWLRRVREGRNV